VAKRRWLQWPGPFGGEHCEPRVGAIVRGDRLLTYFQPNARCTGCEMHIQRAPRRRRFDARPRARRQSARRQL